MKTVLLYLLALAISFEAFAYEKTGQIIGNYKQEPLILYTTEIAQNTRAVSWSQAIPATNTVDQVASERQEELITEISIYSLIILVYSIYWQKNSKPTE